MVAQLRAPGAGAAEQDVIFSRDGNAIVEAGLHRWYARRDLTIIGVLASAGVAPTGDDLIFDVKLDGVTTIFTTSANRPTIIDGMNVTTSPAPDLPDVPAGHFLTVDIDQVGSVLPGAKVDVRILYE